MNFLKQSILRLLRRCGYVLIKTTDFERVIAATAEQTATASGEREHSPQPMELGTHVESVLVGDARPFFDQFAGRGNDIHPMKTCALYSAMQYLTKARISGDIVDCGDGSATALTAIAAMLVALGDTSRRLILLDVTIDPTHHAESELMMWGGNCDLLSDQPVRPTQPKALPLPNKLIASGYPTEMISLMCYPYGALNFTQSIAFLGLTSQTYPANRNAIAALIPLIPSGGIIAAEADLSKPDMRDAVSDFLNQGSINVQLWHVTPTYRIGMKYERQACDSQSIAR
jgi:hypothetical protein